MEVISKNSLKIYNHKGPITHVLTFLQEIPFGVRGLLNVIPWKNALKLKDIWGAEWCKRICYLPSCKILFLIDALEIASAVSWWLSYSNSAWLGDLWEPELRSGVDFAKLLERAHVVLIYYYGVGS